MDEYSNPNLEENIKNNALTVFMLLASVWLSLFDDAGYEPYGESIGFDEMERFAKATKKTALTHGFWRSAVYLLNEKGLVQISGINSSGLEEVSLTSFACFHVVYNQESYDDLFNFAKKQLEIQEPNETYKHYESPIKDLFYKKIIFSKNDEYRPRQG